jgi:thymidylate synthase
MRYFSNFKQAHATLEEDFVKHAYPVHTDRWQAVSISSKPEMEMRELFNVSFSVSTGANEKIEHWKKDILPNLPFADEHFQERVSGHGTNPGSAWKIWPWSNAADAHRTEGGRFTHTYQERFWPNNLENDHEPFYGIRYRYGDYNSLLEHLVVDPLSRQAYLPIWFPEDGTCPGRKPCTLGYHFLMRHDYLHLTYYIRSCDFVRHWRDDCYLAIRLLLETLRRLRGMDIRWEGIKPGFFVMHIVSLHMFVNDYAKIKERLQGTSLWR